MTTAIFIEFPSFSSLAHVFIIFFYYTFFALKSKTAQAGKKIELQNMQLYFRLKISAPDYPGL